MQASTFKEAIDNKRFLEAEDMIKRGDDLLKSQFAFKLSDAFPQIIQNNAYHVFDVLIEHDHIELDIFEYDSFRDTIFNALVLHAKDNDETITFLDNFIPQVENLTDELGNDTWLSMAFIYGAPARVIETLINHGFDVSHSQSNYLAQALSSSRANKDLKKEYVELLVNHGADINQGAPLNIAVYNRDQELATLLLDHGADPNLPEEKNAYHIAILENQDLAMAQLCMNYVPMDFQSETNRNTTMLFDFLNGHFYSIGETEKGFLTLFAENGADPLAISEDYYGNAQTPLDVIAQKSFELFDAFTDAFDIDVNQPDDNGNTLLHKVAGFNVNYEEVKAKGVYRKVKKLLKMGADVSIRNTEDKTAMDLASNDDLKAKTVALLLKQQA